MLDASQLTCLIAQAPAAPAAPAGAGAGGGEAPNIGSILTNPMFMLLFMFAFMYFLVIRPSRKQQQTFKQMLNNVGPKAKVIACNGLIGTIVSIDQKVSGVNGDEDEVSLKLSEGVKVKVLRNSITRILETEPATAETKS